MNLFSELKAELVYTNMIARPNTMHSGLGPACFDRAALQVLEANHPSFVIEGMNWVSK